MGPNVLGTWKRKRTSWDFPGDPVLKNQPSNAGDLDLIPGAEAETSSTLATSCEELTH